MLPDALKLLLEEFDSIDDPLLRAELLIEYGEQFQQPSERVASRPYPPENKVPACESDAYLFYVYNNKRTLEFFFAVENPQGISAKALATILQETLSGSKPEELLEIDESIAHRIFGKELSMGKGLGLGSMIRELRRVAQFCCQ